MLERYRNRLDEIKDGITRARREQLAHDDTLAIGAALQCKAFGQGRGVVLAKDCRASVGSLADVDDLAAKVLIYPDRILLHGDE